MAKKQNAELKPFVFEDRERISREILEEILESYKTAGPGALNLLPEHGNTNTITGVSEVSLKSSWAAAGSLSSTSLLPGISRESPVWWDAPT